MAGGQLLSTGSGSFGISRSVALSGEQISSGHGTVTYHPEGGGDPGEEALSGQEISVGQGTLGFLILHGQQITVGQGAVLATIPPPALTGQGIATGQGTLTAVGNNVTVHISGEEISGLTGIVAIGPVLLTGVQGSFAAGSMGNTRDVPLVGSQVSVEQGFIVPNIEADDTKVASAHGNTVIAVSVDLNGSEVSLGHGAVSTASKEAQLDGEELSVEQESMGVSLPLGLSGQQALAEQQSMGAPGSATLTGQGITTASGTLAGPIPLTGAEITFGTGTIIPGRDVTAEINGIDMTASLGSVEGLVTRWTPGQRPTSTWTKRDDPSSTWTKQSDPSSSWTRQ